MVCQRCIMAVSDILDKIGIPFHDITLGTINTVQPLNDKNYEILKKNLESVGFSIVEDRTQQIINSIKARVLSFIADKENLKQLNLSQYITQEIFYDYSYLSDLFSKTENKTIEQYFIEQRLDLVKEKLKYSDESLTNIAFDCGFSSPQHLTQQFKQYIGMTPSNFRKTHHS